jgi:hypothetical protein
VWTDYLTELARDGANRCEASEPGWLAFVGMTAEEAADHLVEEACALRARLGDEHHTRGDLVELFDPELFFVDLATLGVSDWAEEWREAEEAGRQICWQRTPRGEKAADAIVVLLTGLANCLAATRLLVLRQFFVQARTLGRSYSELSDLAIAVLYDEDTFDAFVLPHDDPDSANRTWRAKLAPRRLRAVKDRLHEELGMPSAIRDYLVGRSRTDMQWASMSAHNNYVALAIGVTVFDVTRPVQRADLGQLDLEAGAGALRKLIENSSDFLLLQLRVLHQRHGWVGDRSNKRQVWAHFREHIMRDMWLEYLRTLEPPPGTEPEDDDMTDELRSALGADD